MVHALVQSQRVDEIVLFDLDRGRSKREVFESALGLLPSNVFVERANRGELEALDLFHAPAYAMPPAGTPRYVFTLHDLTVLALTRGATILAVSKATKEETVRLLALPTASVEVVPPILNPIFRAAGDREQDAAVAARLGVREPFVLAVASLEPRKNFGRLLDAWTSLGTATGAHQLVVVAAEGWRQGRVRRRLERMTGDGSVVKIGHIPDGALASLYRRANAFVFPSLAEGFGLPVVEAMACGAPVVTSRVSSLPEVSGDAALLVDPEDTDEIAAAIARLLADRRLHQRLRDRGLERARSYAREAVVPRLFEVYRRAAQR
jgi:glycosyltransferase involved in cell wall biosynthesis